MKGRSIDLNAAEGKNGDGLCSYRVDRKPLLISPVVPALWGFSLPSAASYYVDRISPNHPLSHHTQASSRPVPEESP